MNRFASSTFYKTFNESLLTVLTVSGLQKVDSTLIELGFPNVKLIYSSLLTVKNSARPFYIICSSVRVSAENAFVMSVLRILIPAYACILSRLNIGHWVLKRFRESVYNHVECISLIQSKVEHILRERKCVTYVVQFKTRLKGREFPHINFRPWIGTFWLPNSKSEVPIWIQIGPTAKMSF